MRVRFVVRMAYKKPLTDEELFEILMNGSDDENEKQLPIEETFSDISDEAEYVIQENEVSSNDEDVLSSEDEFEESINRTIEVAGRRWKYLAPKRGKIRAPDFIRKEKGLTEKSKDIKSILDCFYLFISDEIFEIIVRCTNQRAKEIITKYNITHEASLESWIDVDLTEMRAFCAILILTGKFREAKENPANLWSSTNKGQYIKPV